MSLLTLHTEKLCACEGRSPEAGAQGGLSDCQGRQRALAGRMDGGTGEWIDVQTGRWMDGEWMDDGWVASG